MRTILICTLMLLGFTYSSAQDIKYVSAENGLVIREKPDRGSNRLGLLEFGTVLEVSELTNLKLDIIDNGRKLSGEWVKVRSVDAYEFFNEGYVFSGFLTEKVLQKRFKTKYDEFTVMLDGITQKEPKNELEDFDNIMFYEINEDESFFGASLMVKHHKQFASIEVYQKHENSIAISDDSSHCDKIKWQHFYSSWKPLRALSKNRHFAIQPITEKEAKRFIDVNVEELKNVVDETCGESWSNSIKDIRSIYDAPAQVVVSKMFFRIIMTGVDGLKTEKIIIFDVPMDCNTKEDSYAKL